jgi:uncharacterized protein (TIGR00369 family)
MSDSTANGRKWLPNSKPCFVCGEDNPAGIQTRFFVEDDKVKAVLRPRPHHCGYDNVVHGGIVAGILDEAMGWAAARAACRMFFTAELTVRYLTPVPADRDLTAVTETVRVTSRLVEARGVLVDDAGTEYARASGRFMPLSPEQTLEVDDNLIYRGDEERVFASLRNARD